MSQSKEEERLVDLILDGKYNSAVRADRKVDRILDQISGPPPKKKDEDEEEIEEKCKEVREHEDNVIDEVPDEDIGATKKDIEKEITEQKTGPGGHIPDGTGPHGRGMGPGGGTASGKGMEEEEEDKINEETEYQKFFKKKMEAWGITSPAELAGAKKKEFFNVVDKEWKAKKESD
jgi:hypothetical protein